MVRHAAISAHTVFDRLVFASAIDRNYVVPYAVMLASFARHNPGAAGAEAFVLHYDLNDDDFTFLSRVSADIGVPVSFIRIPAYPFNLFESRRRRNVKALKTMSPVAYAKAFLDRFLPHDLRAVICIDADVVINGAMDELVGMPFAQPLAAVGDTPLRRHSFNSGFMLIDLDEWRRWGVADVCERFLLHYADAQRMHDQQTLNMLFRGRWHKLGLKWNYIENHHRHCHLRKRAAYSAAEVEAARADPVVIHYTMDKPWHARPTHPHADIYRTQRRALSVHFAGLSLADPQENEKP